MATTTFYSGASNQQGTVVLAGGSATNNVKSGSTGAVGGLSATSAHLGLARVNSSLGLTAPDDIQTVASVSIGTANANHVHAAVKDYTVGLDLPAMSLSYDTIIDINGQYHYNSSHTSTMNQPFAVTTSTWASDNIGSMNVSFAGPIPSANAY